MRRFSRRAFLQTVVSLGAGAVLFKFSDGSYRIALAAGPEAYQLRIVHTNDHHSRIEPALGVQIGTAGTPPAAVRRDLGGVARRKTLFDQIRADASVQDKLFLDAGDIFQGTLYFNQYAGAADLWFYNALGYDAVTFGNHEFDKGDQTLADFVAGATFPIVCANLTAATPSPLNALQVTTAWTTPGRFAPHRIVTLPSGKKIGIFGLITPETPNISSPSASVSFSTDLASIANAQVTALKGAGADIVIALTHIGYLADLQLAAATAGISVIVGGHSHSPLLPNPTATPPPPFGQPRVDGAYPTVVQGTDGNSVLVVSSWEWGKWVGDITVGFDAANLVTGVSSASGVPASAPRPVWANAIPAGRTPLPGEGAEIAADATFVNKITSDYKPAVDALATQRIGNTTIELSNARVREAETPLGNLLADAMRLRLQRATADNPQNLPIVCIINGGGIRTSIPAGDITLGKLLEVIPFGNALARVDLTGAQLLAALENGVSALGGTSGTGRFANVSGLRYWFNRSGQPARPPVPATSTTPALPAQKGTRIFRCEVLIGTTYQPVDPTRIYRVATNNFMLAGGDGYFVFTPGGDQADPAVGAGTNQLDTGLIDADIVSEYITANSPLTPRTEQRILQTVAFMAFIGREAVLASP